MGIYGDIYTAIKTTLENNATLKTYVKAVYGGVRTDIPMTKLPCIILEPLGIPEEWVAFPHKRRGKFMAEIHCVLNIYDNDKQLIGGTTDGKGVIDFAQDVLNALDADVTLGGKCSTSLGYIKEGGFIYEYFPQREIIVIFEAEIAFTKGAR